MYSNTTKTITKCSEKNLIHLIETVHIPIVGTNARNLKSNTTQNSSQTTYVQGTANRHQTQRSQINMAGWLSNKIAEKHHKLITNRNQTSQVKA